MALNGGCYSAPSKAFLGMRESKRTIVNGKAQRFGRVRFEYHCWLDLDKQMLEFPFVTNTLCHGKWSGSGLVRKTKLNNETDENKTAESDLTPPDTPDTPPS